jgi:TP901 family phage tail tape measure protein|nr:MAG TPA: minor tail protein [Caudoviricetes sp.]
MKIRLDISAFTSAMSNVRQGFEDAQKRLEKFSKAGEKLKDIGSNLTDKVTKPLIAVGTAATAAAVESDNALTKIQSSLGLTENEANEVLKTVRTLSKKGFDFGDATESIIAVKQTLGDLLSPDEVEDFTTEVLSLSKAFDVDAQDSIKAASLMMRNFGISGQNATDIIAYGMKNGLNVSGDFLDTLHEYAPQMSKLGYTAEETLSIIAKGMENGAFNTDKLLDGVKEARLRLSEMNDDAASAIKTLGLNAKTVQSNIAAGGATASAQMKEVAQKISEMKDPIKQNTAATAIFGTQWEDTGDSLLAAVAEGSSSLEGLAGTADSVSDTVENGFSAQITALWNTLKELGATIGESLLPILKDMVDKVTPIIEKTVEWIKNNPELVSTLIGIAGAVAALGPVLSVIGTGISAASSLMSIMSVIGSGSLIPVFAAMTPVITAVAAVLGTLLVAKIGDSNTAILGLQEKFGAFGFFLGGICEYISGVIQLTFGNMLIIIKTVLEVIQAVITGRFKDIPGIIKESGAEMELNTQEAMDKMCLTATRGMDNLRNATVEQLQGTVNSMQTILDAVPNIVNGEYEEASNNLAAQLNNMDSQQINILQGMNDTTRMMFSGIQEGMTVEESAKQVQYNLETMAKAGKIDAETMQKDVTAAMDLMKQKMDAKTEEAAQAVDANTAEAAQAVESNTQKAAQSASINLFDAKKAMKDATKGMATDTASNTAQVAQVADSNFKKANQSIKQSADTMYSDSNKSYTKLAEAAKKSVTSMSGDVTSNAEKMSSNAKSSVANMSNGVTSSTNSMANKSINDWSRLRSAYSKTITGKIQITKTESTIQRTQRALAQSLNSLTAAINSTGGFSAGAISRNAVATSNNNVSINFNGSYSFRDRNDMDYFMSEAAKRMKRKI